MTYILHSNYNTPYRLKATLVKLICTQHNMGDKDSKGDAYFLDMTLCKLARPSSVGLAGLRSICRRILEVAHNCCRLL